MYNVYISTIYIIYNRSSEPSQSIMTSILDFLQLKAGSCQEALQEQRAPRTCRSANDQGHHLDLQTSASKALIGECISYTSCTICVCICDT